MKRTVSIFVVSACTALLACGVIERNPGGNSQTYSVKGDSAGFNGKHPRNVVLLIGDGMGLSQITAGMIARRDKLNLERFPVVGLVKTWSASHLVTDSGAGATAFATGQRTYNGAIGVDVNKRPLRTILEIAEENGLSTGLVATSSITHATPASFIAHQPDREMHEQIAADFLRTPIDVFIGGGRRFFSTRTDGRNLIAELRDKGYLIADSIHVLDTVSHGMVAGFLADENPVPMFEGRGHVLAQSSLTALRILSKNEKGFFLMAEGSQIDWGGHENNPQYIIQEMLDFDHAVGKVLDWAEKDGHTLVIVISDHETGGFAITGGDLDSGTVETAFVTNYHTAEMVAVFAYGPGAEAFAGIFDNTEIFFKMKKALNFP